MTGRILPFSAPWDSTNDANTVVSARLTPTTNRSVMRRFFRALHLLQRARGPGQGAETQISQDVTGKATAGSRPGGRLCRLLATRPVRAAGCRGVPGTGRLRGQIPEPGQAPD